MAGSRIGKWPNPGAAAAAVLLVWCAVAAGAQEPGPEPAPLSMEDFALVHRDTGYLLAFDGVGQDVSDVLGEPTRVAVKESPAGPKYDRITEWYPGLTVSYYRDSHGISYLAATSPDFQTPRGVAVGDLADEARARYTGEFIADGWYVYSVRPEGERFYFVFSFGTREGAITNIIMNLSD